MNDQELKRAIKVMKENNVTDHESGIIAEYIKALGEQNLKNVRVLMNDVLSGECIPKEWKESRVVLVHNEGSRKEVRNYRPIVIINVICKLCMMLIRDSINGWVEESGMLGDVIFFRRGRRADNLFMLERMIEVANERKECLFVAFIDMEKAYDIANRKKLLEVMRGYGGQEKWVEVIERIYDGGMVKFELERIMTGSCKSDFRGRDVPCLHYCLTNIIIIIIIC